MGRVSLSLLLLSLLLLGCSKSDRKSDSSESSASSPASFFSGPEEQREYVAELLKFRTEKDSFLRTSPASPLTKEDRRTFRGLHYYEPEPRFIVRATLHRVANPHRMTITTSTGDDRDAIKYGTLAFELAGRQYELGVYKFLDKPGKAQTRHLFVPFTDSTSGRETYGAGRYLDLEENETGEYVLDFNKAYNPYCAYNENYSCPIPPRENRLSLAITAGEKVFHDED
jgi:uncharacterized protein (DUF1684 family)